MDTTLKTDDETPTTPIQIGKNKGFFSHVFSFNDEAKHDLMNLVQYSATAFVPIVCLIKLVEYLFPKTEETKGNVELLAEIFGQLVILLIGIYFIHRFVTYFNPFSGKQFAKVNLFSAVMVFLVLAFNARGTFTIGDSMNMLYDNVSRNWRHNTDDSVPEEHPEVQPSIQQQQPQQHQSNQMMPQFDNMYVDKPISLPKVEAMGGYAGQRNAMEGGMSPMMGNNEPMAANEILGHSGVSF